MSTLVGMLPCIAACSGSPSVRSETSVTIYMPWFHTRQVLSVHSTLASTSHGRTMTKVNGSIQMGQSGAMFGVLMEHFASITNLSTISSAILFALAPSVSTPLPFIANSLITSSNVTIIMPQAMLLTVKACIFSPFICPKLICHSSPCVGTGYRQFLYRTLMATWDRVC